jgi:hypothetical protein
LLQFYVRTKLIIVPQDPGPAAELVNPSFHRR